MRAHTRDRMEDNRSSVAKSCRLLLQQNNNRNGFTDTDGEIKRVGSMDAEDNGYRGLSYFLKNADNDVVGEQPLSSNGHRDCSITDRHSKANYITEMEEEWDPMASERDHGECLQQIIYFM